MQITLYIQEENYEDKEHIMGIDKIEISTLTGKLQAQANVVDDGNGVLEGKEIELFQNAAKTTGLAESEDYKAIFGADIKAAPASTTPVVLSEKETETKQNAVKDFTKTLVKGKVRPESLMTELKKQFKDAKYSPMLKEVEYVLGLVTKAVKESKEADPKKAIEKIDDTAKKQMKTDKKWDGFHKDIYNALKDQAKEAQIQDETQALVAKYNEVKGTGINYKEAVKKVKEELEKKGADGKKEWDKSYTQEAFKRLENYAEGDALDYVDDKLGERYQGVRAGTVTEANTKDTLKAQNTSNDDYIDKAIGHRKKEIKVTDRGAKVNQRAFEISKMTRNDLKDKLGDELFEKLDRSYLAKVMNEDGVTYDLSKLSAAIRSRAGADDKVNQSQDKQMAEFQMIKEHLASEMGLPLSDKKKDKTGLTDKDVNKLIDFCKIEKEGKDHCPKIVKAVRDGVVGAVASGGYTKMTQTVTVNIASEDAARTLADLKAQGITPSVTDLGNGRLGIKIFQEMITPDAIIGLGLGIATGALFDAIFGNDRDEKSCMSIANYDINDPKYTNAEKYKEHVATIYAKSPEKVDALHKLVDAYHKQYGEEWHAHFQQALRDVAGIGSKLNPEECRMLKYQKVQEPEKKPPVDEPENNPEEEDPIEENPVEEKCPLTKTPDHVDTTLTHKVKYGDSWEELVNAYFPTWKQCFGKMYGKGGAIQALKRAVAANDREYQQLLAGKIPSSINIPEALGECQRDDNGKVKFVKPHGTPKGYMGKVGKTTGYNTVTLTDCNGNSGTGKDTTEALTNLNARVPGKNYTEEDIVE